MTALTGLMHVAVSDEPTWDSQYQSPEGEHSGEEHVVDVCIDNLMKHRSPGQNRKTGPSESAMWRRNFECPYRRRRIRTEIEGSQVKLRPETNTGKQ